MTLEIQYRILNLYKTKQYEECLKACAETKEDFDQRMIDFIRLRAQTILAKTAANGYEEVGYGIHDDELATTAVAKTPRPGTSFQKATAKTATTAMPMNRATTTAKRRTAASTGRTSTARSAQHTATITSRAATAAAGSHNPLAPGAPLTLTLVTKQDQLFKSAAKSLFEYVLFCEGDVRKALDITSQAQKSENTSDWWWDFASAKCYLTLGMHRAAEGSLRQALKKNKHIAIYLRLIAMYVDLNQPISALEVCKQGLEVFHEDTALMTEQARIHDEMGNSSLAVQGYRRVAIQDAMNMEAIANIAMHNFYNDQPEIALRYYRRLLVTCPAGPEIYNNLGLCCLYCNQWDLILPCFRQALYYSTTSTVRAEIWFNLAHVALSTGDTNLGRRCLQLSIAMNSEHTAARAALRAVDIRTSRTRNGDRG